MWPDVAVLIVTYDRPEEIRLTIRSLREGLVYSGHLHWHLADDASPAGYLEGIEADFPDLNFTSTVTQRKGWGTNVNTAFAFLQKFEYVYLNEDDYMLCHDLYLNKGIALLKEKENIGLVRYDGIVGHDLNLELRETRSCLNYLRVRKDSPALNIYSNRPHLRHRRFTEAYGRYPEGWSLGRTEQAYAHGVKQHPGPDVALFPDGLLRAFLHLGRTRQGTKLDPNRGK